MVKDDRTNPGQWKDPASLTFGLGSAAKTTLPMAVGPVAAGPVWMIGSSQENGVPWVGANTQHPSLLQNSTGDVTWDLVGFKGPGSMAVFEQGDFGTVKETWFHASNNAPDQAHASHTIEKNRHVHPSWVFDKAGTYKVTFRHTVTAANGAKASGEATLTFEVGGAGNANDGHFDFGTAVGCGTGAGATGGAAPVMGGTTAGTVQPGTYSTEGTFGFQDHSGTGIGFEGSFGSSDALPYTAASSETNIAAPAPAGTAPAGGAAPVGGEDGKCTPGITPMVKDDRSVPAEWKDPASMVFGLGDAAKADLPQAVGPVPAGPVWMIGSTQQSGVPWLGANTQHPSLLENTSGDVVYEVSRYEGPGAMVVFTQGGLGQIVGEEWFRANEGKSQGSHTIPANSHVHPSWVFSQPGTYHVTVKQSTTSKSGEQLSGEATLTFNVGGAGNADDGHFDFGATYDPEGSCSTGAAGAGAKGGGGTAQAAGGATSGGTAAAAGQATRGGELAETGTTVMTLPFAVLGLGILVFGGGMVALDTRLRKRIFATVGSAE